MVAEECCDLAEVVVDDEESDQDLGGGDAADAAATGSLDVLVTGCFAGVAGADVRQLQQFLAELGYYHDAIDGKVEGGTDAAIKRWQESLGLDRTGVVGLGDVIFIPQLPTRIVLDDDVVHRGATLSGGENAVLGLPLVPDFWIPVTPAQAAMMPAGTAIEVNSPGGTLWRGITGAQRNDAEGNTLVAAEGAGGEPLCGEQCAEIPTTGQTTMASSIITVPTTDGLVVPSSALVTLADGSTAVIDESGERIGVEIVVSARGISVISGVAEGTRVQVPASDGGSE